MALGTTWTSGLQDERFKVVEGMENGRVCGGMVAARKSIGSIL